ncbi:MAG: EAL domain-containing protein [Candidatus Sulfotelmatobacter sp.]|jgi:diguanylate cyclase (GGDEF)-like protein/PAS domain S-box-containing protein
MSDHWQWIALGTLILLAIYEEIRIYRIHRESKKREELFQIVTENAADMIALVDVKGNRLYNSPAYRRVLGYSPAELGETSSFDQIHPDDRFKVLEAAREARSTGIGKKLEYRIRHKDGSWRILESIAGTIRNAKGEVAKLVIVNRDITDRKRAEQQAEHNSFHDGLTGLPNRRLFLDRLEQLFERAQRNPQDQYAILFVDLDGFKLFNNTMGPAAGDQILVEAGHRIAAALRDEDTEARPQNQLAARNAALSRLGGDEFTILLEGITDPSDAMRVAQRILLTVAKPLLIEGREIHPSASVGIAISAITHDRAEDLLQDADVAMRRAKSLGGSRCEVFDEAMHNRAVNRMKLEAELRQAIAQDQFRVHFQPIVQLASREIIGFEAFLRWQHPDEGLISPHHFIAAAEDSGLLYALGHWLIVEACKQLHTWKNRHPAISVSISVNLSAKQLADARFIPELQAAIREAGVAPSRLQLEMTETVAATDPKLTVKVLSFLKQLGVGVILDDFGTGNSSLSGLRLFPVEALKIDRSLITGMLADRGTTEMVELIVLLGHKLKLKIIAEGIESAKHWERLCELGCDLGQGYFFSQPVDAEGAGRLLSQRDPALQAKVAGGAAQ